MTESYTAGARRALDRAQARARRRGALAVEPIDLLIALVHEAESRAAALLAEFGLDTARVCSALGVDEDEPPAAAAEDDGEGALDVIALPHSPAIRTALTDATVQARGLERSRAVGTEHLLAGLLTSLGPAADLLARAGLELTALIDHLTAPAAAEAAPLALPHEIPPLELNDPGEAVDLGRVLDASANRASEGLRVVEDYVRFVLEDPALCRRIKEARHRLGAAIRGLDLEALIGARDTRGDVGTHIMTVTEGARENPRAVLTANFKRAAEALRTLEEYGKLIDPWLAGRFEVLRYDVYTLEKLTLTAVRSFRALGEARLMVLVGGLPTLGDLTWIVGEALAGGADVIQYREKGLTDREWLRRAREVRILTAGARARLIVNDRPDLARLASADGVHLGQEDVALRDARRIVGPSALIGVSTHEPSQLDKAVLDGASYLGVGPVFSSTTKEFADLAGLAYVRHAAETTNLPWFAIGGITEENLDQVLEAGATRIAVSAAVVRAEQPCEAAAALRRRLEDYSQDLVQGSRAAMLDERVIIESEPLQRPRYRRMRAIFLRGLGAVYLAAFASLAVQVDGLIGSRGILPAAEFLGAVGPVLGHGRYGQLPTVLWLDCSDRALHLLCWGGVAVSALLVAGVLPRVCLMALWLGYLSLVSVGQPFLGFQWDTLLLEAGLLGILFAPWTLWLGWAQREPSLVVVWLIRWLVFRLMFESGVVKLTSGDPTWRAWDALKYHYETQPLPTWTSWYMHQLPPWFQALSIGVMFWAELIAPWFVFGPRRLRLVGFGSLVLLQVLIAATGNYGFFNVLSVVLCLALVEDQDWSRLRPDPRPAEPALRGWWRTIPVAVAAAVIVVVTTMQGLDRTGPTVIFPAPLEALRGWVEPFHSMNAYGLFAVMTTERPEIVVEGSDDGETWVPYGFRWKPGDVGRRPRFTTPHMPRLDWQMWFAALAGDCRSQRWFFAFEQRLLEGSPDVLGLLQDNPFPAHPPRYLRARLRQYRFTGRGAEAWWQWDEAGIYCPPMGRLFLK